MLNAGGYSKSLESVSDVRMWHLLPSLEKLADIYGAAIHRMEQNAREKSDAGTIRSNGEEVTLRSSADAQRNGIAAIYQEPAIFPDLNVAENIFISHQGRGAIVGWRQMFRQAEQILAELGVALDVRRPASGLTLAAQQSVEIAKAISLKVRVLIMDEPTAALGPAETSQVHELVAQLKSEGIGIFLISHDIHDVFDLSDRISVMYHGRIVDTVAKTDVTADDVLAMIILGKKPDEVTEKDKAVIELRG